MGRAWLAPLYAPSLLTTAKSFVDNPLVGSRRLNALGLHVARMKLAHRLAWRRRARLRRLIPEADALAFDRDGFVVKEDFLPAEVFQALQAQVRRAAAPSRIMVQGEAVTRRLAVDAQLLRQAPALRAFLDSPAWLGLMRYVGSFRLWPLVYLQAIFSHSASGAADPQTRVHSDTFHPTVKAFYFLEDLDPSEGPFTYVRGSHRLTPGRLAWEQAQSLSRASSDDLQTARGSPRATFADLAAMGYGPPEALPSRANTLIVADTSGFHARGASTRASTRVEIWAYSRRNPFLPWLGGDWLSLPWVRGRAGELYWRYADLKRRILGVRDVWRPAETTTLAAAPNRAVAAQASSH